MKTKAILFLNLFMVMLRISGSSANNQRNNSYSSPPSPVQSTMTTSNDAPDNKPIHTSDQTQTVMMTEEKSDNEQKDISPATSSPSYLSIGTSFRATEQPDQSSLAPHNSTVPPSPKTTHKFMLFYILLAIVVLMLFVGCLHAMRESGQDSSVTRILLGVRQRLRAVISNVEVRMGHRLWPGGKRENDDDEEEAERRQGDDGAQRVDDGGKEGSCGARNEKKGEHKEDDSDDSRDCSSMAVDKLRETALSTQEEEERKQSGNKDEEETSSESEGRQSDVEGESKGDKKGGSEDMALFNSVQEDEEKADLCDVTVL